jgi:nitroreductase
MKENIKVINGYEFIRRESKVLDEHEVDERSKKFMNDISARRTVREFSEKEVSREIIENLILAASSAPSGANKQPWTFCVVSNPELKKQIREAAEKEEYESYNNRMNEQWLEDLKPLQTDWHKSFLEDAPHLIVVFKKVYDLDEKGEKRNNYYVTESVGLACGFLLVAIHQAGLVALTHTPSPMNFLSAILKRPENERPFLLIPVGFPNEETYVPNIKRKELKEVAVFY